MQRKLSAIIVILSCLPAAAQDVGPRLQQVVQGKAVTITGRAHLQHRAEGVFIEIENAHTSLQVSGFVPFDDLSTFPDLPRIDGRNVAITGLLILDGDAVIQMDDPAQLQVKD